MAQAREVTLHRRAQMALYAFSPSEQAKVKEVVRMLGDPDSDALVRARAVKVLTPEPMYLVRAGPEVRVIFRKSVNDVEILDLVRSDTLRAFAKKYAGAAESLDKKTVEAQESLDKVKLRVRAGESIQEAVRRFRKLCERSGLRKEMRRKAYYEKPSERRRREELKRLRKARQSQQIAGLPKKTPGAEGKKMLRGYTRPDDR